MHHHRRFCMSSLARLIQQYLHPTKLRLWTSYRCLWWNWQDLFQPPSSSFTAICVLWLVRGAVLSPTLIGSASTHSCSEVNAVDFVRRTCRGSTNYLKTPTLLCFIKSPLTVVMSCISFYRHFRRLYRTIVCAIELISSACRTTQDALWIVTFLLGPCSRMFINSF